MVRVVRIYEPPTPGDGARVLVDRLWPRGISKDAAALDEWCRDVAPSDDLRRWFDHDPSRFGEFTTRYRAELTEPTRAAAFAALKQRAAHGDLTLLTATKAVDISQAAVLALMLNDSVND